MNDIGSIDDYAFDISFDDIEDKNEMMLQEKDEWEGDEWDDDGEDDDGDDGDDGEAEVDEVGWASGDLDISWIQSYEKELGIDKNILREPVHQITIKTVYISPVSVGDGGDDDGGSGAGGYQIIKCSDEIVKTCMINNKHALTKEFLLHYIQSRKVDLTTSPYKGENLNLHRYTPLKDNIRTADISSTKLPLTDLNLHRYKLDSIVTYVVSIEPEEIQAYTQTEGYVELSTNAFMKKYNVIEDLLFSDSIFVFHPINCVYLFLTENVSGGAGGGYGAGGGCAGGVGYIKSILKNKTRKCYGGGGDADEEVERPKNNITKKVYFFDETPEPVPVSAATVGVNTKKSRNTRKNGGHIVVRKNITRKTRT